MTVAVFKGHRASTVAIQYDLVGATGDEILAAAAVAVELGKITLNGQRASREIIAKVSGNIGETRLHNEITGYVDTIRLVDHS